MFFSMGEKEKTATTIPVKWDAIKKTATSEPWKKYFPNYECPYYHVSEELKTISKEKDISLCADSVSQEYEKDGKIRLRNYLSGITPIYSSMQTILINNQENPADIAKERDLFLDAVIRNLTETKNNTFCEYENGSSRFNYTRVVMKGALPLQIEHYFKPGQ